MEFVLTKIETPTNILEILKQKLGDNHAVMLHSKEDKSDPVVVLGATQFYALLDGLGYKDIPIQYAPHAGRA